MENPNTDPICRSCFGGMTSSLMCYKCKEMSCESCIIMCDECGTDVCYWCWVECDVCGNPICENCICPICRKCSLCKDTGEECKGCLFPLTNK